MTRLCFYCELCHNWINLTKMVRQFFTIFSHIGFVNVFNFYSVFIKENIRNFSNSYSLIIFWYKIKSILKFPMSMNLSFLKKISFGNSYGYCSKLPLLQFFPVSQVTLYLIHTIGKTLFRSLLILREFCFLPAYPVFDPLR